MKRLPLLILTMAFIVSCNSKQNSQELEKLNQELNKKENQITELQKRVYQLEYAIKSANNGDDYYRFVPINDAEINVAERLEKGTQRIIDQKKLKDTLDKTINYIYEHTSKIIQINDPYIESILRDMDEDKSAWGNDYFVRVMTFYNGRSLPLETENENTDIYIIIRPTELGFENRTFVISDFHEVKLDSLKWKENSVELEFTHGANPRKKERILIRPELVKFKNK